MTPFITYAQETRALQHSRMLVPSPDEQWRVIASVVLALTCAGCGSGFGFHAGGPEMPRLRQVLALKEGMVVADVGAGKGQLTLALAAEWGRAGAYLRLKSIRRGCGGFAKLSRAKLGNVTVVEAQSRETALPPSCCGRSCCGACITT